jgi:hypothetical protein
VQQYALFLFGSAHAQGSQNSAVDVAIGKERFCDKNVLKTSYFLADYDIIVFIVLLGPFVCFINGLSN